MSNCCQAALHVDETVSASLHAEESATIALGVGGSMYAVGPPYYEGSYDIVPSSEVQTIRIDGMRAAHDLIIESIPSNYGLITWDGSIITVS